MYCVEQGVSMLCLLLERRLAVGVAGVQGGVRCFTTVIISQLHGAAATEDSPGRIRDLLHHCHAACVGS